MASHSLLLTQPAQRCWQRSVTHITVMRIKHNYIISSWLHQPKGMIPGAVRCSKWSNHDMPKCQTVVKSLMIGCTLLWTSLICRVGKKHAGGLLFKGSTDIAQAFSNSTPKEVCRSNMVCMHQREFGVNCSVQNNYAAVSFMTITACTCPAQRVPGG